MLFNYSIDIEFHLEAYYVAKVHALAKCSRALLSSHPASAARNSTAFKDGFGARRFPSLPLSPNHDLVSDPDFRGGGRRFRDRYNDS